MERIESRLSRRTGSQSRADNTLFYHGEMARLSDYERGSCETTLSTHAMRALPLNSARELRRGPQQAQLRSDGLAHVERRAGKRIAFACPGAKGGKIRHRRVFDGFVVESREENRARRAT